MTVSSLTTRVDYTGSGTVGPFSFSFRIMAATDVEVTTAPTAGGVETTLAYPTDFSVSGVGNSTGGSITLATALTTGYALTIRRVLPLLQSTSIRNQGAYFPATIEDMNDRAVMMAQQLSEVDSRAMSLGVTIDPSVVSAVVPPPAVNTALFWNSTGTALETRLIDTSGIAVPGAGRTVISASSYMANNAVFNWKDYGAVGDGVADDYAAAILCFNALIANGGGLMRTPVGHYKLAQNLVYNLPAPAFVPLGFRWEGDGDSSILFPGASVTIGLTCTNTINNDGYNSAFVIDGIRIDMVNAASGATGILVNTGVSGVGGPFRFNNVTVMRADGTGGIGLDIRDIVGFMGTNCYFGRNATGVRVLGTSPDLPTYMAWHGSHFRESGELTSGATEAGIGYDIQQGFLTEFDDCIFEANWAEGLRIVPSGIALAANAQYCWFESNQRKQSTSAKWQTGNVVVGGSGSLQVAHCLFNGNSQSLKLTGAVNSKIEDVTIARLQALVVGTAGLLGLSATATGYARNDVGGDFTGAFQVGQRINARGFATATLLGTGTVTLTAGVGTFSVSQAGLIVVGAKVIISTAEYIVTAFNGTTGVTISAGITVVASAFTLCANNKYATVTAVSATTLDTDGVSIAEPVLSGVARSITVVFVTVDHTSNGSFGSWQHNNSPVEMIENNALYYFNGFDTYASNGVLIVDPLTKALTPGTSGQVALGTTLQRFKELFVSDSVTATNNFTASVGSFFHGSSGTYNGPSTGPTVIQYRTGQSGLIRDDLNQNVLGWQTAGVRVYRALQEFQNAPAYSASITIDATLANSFAITATNGTAFTLNAPTGPVQGQVIRVTVRNTSGGALGVITWNAVFKMAAWTNPANGFSRTITFVYNGTNWVEQRDDVDVPN